MSQTAIAIRTDDALRAAELLDAVAAWHAAHPPVPQLAPGRGPAPIWYELTPAGRAALAAAEPTDPRDITEGTPS